MYDDLQDEAMPPVSANLIRTMMQLRLEYAEDPENWYGNFPFALKSAHQAELLVNSFPKAFGGFEDVVVQLEHIRAAKDRMLEVKQKQLVKHYAGHPEQIAAVNTTLNTLFSNEVSGCFGVDFGVIS